MRTKTIAYTLLVASLISGSLFPVLLGFGKGINLYEFMFLISVFGLISSLYFVYWRGKLSKLRSLVSDPKLFAIALLAGLLSLLPIEFGIAYAEQFVSASLATVIFRTSPLLMLILLPIILRERLSRYQIVAIVLAFFGLYIGLSGGSLTNLNYQYAPIIIFLALMALFYALGNVLVKRYMFDIEIQLAAAGISFFAFSSIMLLATGASLQPIGMNSWLLVFYIGAIFNVYSFYMAFYALRRVKTTLYMNVYFLSPFVTFVFSYLLLGEAIKLYYIAIALAVGAGIVIQQFDRVGGLYITKSGKNEDRNFFIYDVTGAFAETKEDVINRNINNGKKVLAIRLPSQYKTDLGRFTDFGIYSSDSPGIVKESTFIRDSLKFRDDDFLLMKVGDIDECESFFDDVEEHFSTRVTK